MLVHLKAKLPSYAIAEKILLFIRKIEKDMCRLKYVALYCYLVYFEIINYALYEEELIMYKKNV